MKLTKQQTESLMREFVEVSKKTREIMEFYFSEDYTKLNKKEKKEFELLSTGIIYQKIAMKRMLNFNKNK